MVNCAQGTKFNQINTDQDYFSDTEIKFHGIRATDVMTYKMTPHFAAAADFIDEALGASGLYKIYCGSVASRISH